MVACPSFLLDLRLAELTDWWLRLECCGRTVNVPCRFIAAQKPEVRFGSLLDRLRCQQCGARPGRVVLVDDPAAGAAERKGAPNRRWVEVVMPDRGPSG